MASISLRGIRSSDRERDAIIDLVTKIRERNDFACPIVCAIESAPGIQASHIERYLREQQLPSLFILAERAGYMEGVPKTESITLEYVYELERALCSNCLVYAKDIITHHKKPEKEKERLKVMMENLRKVPRKQQQEHGDQRFQITAKLSGQPDDMLIALCMCLYWRKKFWEDRTGKYRLCREAIRAYRDISFPI